MRVDVTTLKWQCSDCGEPVDTAEIVGLTSVLLEPCSHTVQISSMDPTGGPAE